MSGNSQAHPESILIVRLGAMGDVLHAMPAVAALRKARPGTEMTWLVEQRWADLLQPSVGEPAATNGVPLVDALEAIDTKRWRQNLLASATWKEVAASIRTLRATRFRTAIDFQGAIKSALLARASGAIEVFGFSEPRESAATFAYGSQVNASAAHVIDQNLELASAVIRESLAPQKVDLPRSFKAEEWCDALLRERNPSRFALLNPGSGWGAKCWPASRHAEVAQRLRSAGLRSLINYGPGEEAIAEDVARISNGAAEKVCCDLSQLVSLTRRASLFIGGDTGPMHLAAALGIPTVALFGPTDPARNGPYWQPSQVLRSAKSVTSYKHVSQADPGLQSIPVDDVVAAASKLLGVPIA